MKSSSSAPPPVQAGRLDGAVQTGGCGGKGASTRMKWLLAGSVALVVAAAIFGSGWLTLAAVLPLLYLLPCLAMAVMCMKGMSKQKSDGAP